MTDKNDDAVGYVVMVEDLVGGRMGITNDGAVVGDLDPAVAAFIAWRSTRCESGVMPDPNTEYLMEIKTSNNAGGVLHIVVKPDGSVIKNDTLLEAGPLVVFGRAMAKLYHEDLAATAAARRAREAKADD